MIAQPVVEPMDRFAALLAILAAAPTCTVKGQQQAVTGLSCHRVGGGGGGGGGAAQRRGGLAGAGL